MKSSGAAAWFAHPVLSALIAVVWLLLQGSLDVVHLLAALLVGLVIPRAVGPFLGAGTRIRRLATAARLAFVVLWDVVVANLTVAWIVLNPASRPQPAWFRVLHGLEHPNAIALLATIITTTPGTVSCVIDEERGEILVHALDCDEPALVVAEILARYAVPLKEIFE